MTLHHPAPEAMNGSFDEALAAVRDVEGWLSDTHARRLWERASALPAPGQIVEIGRVRGRSTIVLARAAPEGVGIVGIAPHASTDRGPRERVTSGELGERDRKRFEANLERAGVAFRVPQVRLRSQDAMERSRGGGPSLRGRRPPLPVCPGRPAPLGATGCGPEGHCSCTTRSRASA